VGLAELARQWLNRQMRMAFEFKEEFDRSGKSPLSATTNIDRSTFSQSTGAAPPA